MATLFLEALFTYTCIYIYISQISVWLI